jgi:hypothetical protein
MKNGPYELVVAPDGYPGKRYRGRYCYEHHLVWWQAHGELPGPGECIHHKNDNKRDNRIENLKLKTKLRHVGDHSHKRGRTMVRFKCPACEKKFVRQKRRSVDRRSSSAHLFFCSRRCIGEFGFSSATEKRKSEAAKTNIIEIFKVVPK